MNNLWRNKPGMDDNRDVERVRDASDIVRIIGEHVALKPKGREFAGLCPFHDDHSPSMYVVPAKGIFHCFVCQAGGDVFSFVKKFHKMEFREALEYLAERAGVTLTPRGRGAFAQDEGEQAADSVSRTDLLSASAQANAFFQGILKHEAHGAAARAVVAKRGISDAMVERFMLGASPDRWDGLLLTLKGKGIDTQSMLEAGLIKRRESDNGHYDSFRNRLMFPIQDTIGRVIAFGARKINPDDEPKYLNSPETRLFNKSATLYALNHAARTIQAERTAIITEGYTDVIACHQAGFTNAVATLGTALTYEHARVLRRQCDTVILLFDGDDAGQRAADRAVDVFLAESLDVKICALSRFTDAKDPDELLKREGGAEVFRAALQGSVDLLEYRFSRVRTKLAGAGLSALSRGIEEEIQRLVERGLGMVAPVRQALIVRRLSELAGVSEATIMRAIPAGRSGPQRGGQTQPQAQGRERESPESLPGESAMPNLRSVPLRSGEHLLGCLLCEGTLWSSLTNEQKDLIAPGAYRWRLMRELAQVMHELGEDGVPPGLSAVLSASGDDDVKQAAVALAQRIEHETDGSKERLASHWRGCFVRAKQDQMDRSQGVEVKPLLPTASDALDQIRLRRASHKELGADRRVLPRPGT